MGFAILSLRSGIPSFLLSAKNSPCTSFGSSALKPIAVHGCQYIMKNVRSWMHFPRRSCAVVSLGSFIWSAVRKYPLIMGCATTSCGV